MNDDITEGGKYIIDMFISDASDLRLVMASPGVGQAMGYLKGDPDAGNRTAYAISFVSVAISPDMAEETPIKQTYLIEKQEFYQLIDSIFKTLEVAGILPDGWEDDES